MILPFQNLMHLPYHINIHVTLTKKTSECPALPAQAHPQTEEQKH